MYLEEVIVFCSTLESHSDHLKKVLELLRASRVSINLKKCALFQEKVDYLGHIVMPRNFAEAIGTIYAVLTAPLPKEKTKLRSSLGARNFYRMFIKGFANRKRPLKEIMR